jgi:hypothetical protein
MRRLLDKIIHSAWEPLTPRGVALFARASLRRVLVAQFLFATLTAVGMVWFVNGAWFSVVREAIGQLPDEGKISRAQLAWRGDSPVRLAGNQFLSLAVDVWHDRKLSREAHVAVEFARRDIRCYSLLGYLELNYPTGWIIPFNRPELEPWWGSRQPGLLAGVAVVTVLGLFASWAVLATAYSFIVWLAAFFTNRNLDWVGGWKFSAAALMPGALFMALTIAAYGLGWLDPVKLSVCFGFHLVIGWIYLLASLSLLPRDPEVAKNKANPFSPA